MSLDMSSVNNLDLQFVKKYDDIFVLVVSLNFLCGTCVSFRHLSSFSIVTSQFVRMFAFSIKAFFASDLSGRAVSLFQ